MKTSKFATIALAIALLLVQVNTSFAGIIFGDATENGPCVETKDETKVDNGVIVYFTGVIVYFTGVIVYLTDSKDTNTENCGIVLSD